MWSRFLRELMEQEVYIMPNQTRWPNKYSIHILCWQIGGIQTLRVIEPWLIQKNDFKIDTCRFLARSSALLG